MQKRPMTHYRPARGDLIRLRSDDSMTGVITDAGSEQSEVKWDDVDCGRGCVPNTQIVKREDAR